MLFISGNLNKVEEIKTFFPDIQSKDVDLSEIQTLDYSDIIEAKLLAAASFLKLDLSLKRDEILVDDIGFEIGCLNGFPGPFVKFYEKNNTELDYFNLCKASNNYKASVVHSLGYLLSNIDGSIEIQIFEHRLNGQVVYPRDGFGSGFYKVFVPESHVSTFSEMSTEERNTISPRGKNLKSLKGYLTK